jgi:hypothetical protein
MSRITDLASAYSIAPSARHCSEFDCQKCRAQSRWLRRRAWRARKSPNRSARDRKR